MGDPFVRSVILANACQRDGEPNLLTSKPQLSDTKFKTQASTNPFENTQNFNFQRTLSTEVPCLSAIPLIQDRNVALAAAREALPPVHVPAEETVSCECSRGLTLRVQGPKY